MTNEKLEVANSLKNEISQMKYVIKQLCTLGTDISNTHLWAPADSTLKYVLDLEDKKYIFDYLIKKHGDILEKLEDRFYSL